MGLLGSSERKGLRYGCLGVLVLLALGVAWVASLFGTAFFRARGEKVERRELSRVLEAPAGAPDSRVAELPEDAAAGRVVLDMTVGEFFVEPGLPGEPLRVEAEYDTRSYALEESMTSGEDSAWEYRLVFRQTGWFQDSGLRVLMGGAFPKITVTLPPDLPIELVGTFSKGGAEIELGGLWLTGIDLSVEKGGLEIEIDRPLAAPVERFRIRGYQGGVDAWGLGNASPRRLDVEQKMGGVHLDLRGRWLRPADVRVSTSMGGATVRIPDDIPVERVDGRLAAPELPADPDLASPRLRLAVTSSMGNVEVYE